MRGRDTDIVMLSESAILIGTDACDDLSFLPPVSCVFAVSAIGATFYVNFTRPKVADFFGPAS